MVMATEGSIMTYLLALPDVILTVHFYLVQETLVGANDNVKTRLLQASQYIFFLKISPGHNAMYSLQDLFITCSVLGNDSDSNKF